MFSLRRRHLLIGVLILLTLLTNAFVAFWNITRLVRNEQLVSRTFETQAQIEHIVSLAKDIETSQRGFILTGDESYLDPFRRAQAQLNPSLAELKNMTVDPQQRRDIPLLSQRVTARFNTARYGIYLRRTQSYRATVRFIRQGQGKREMDSIRQLADKMKGRADELLALRTGESSDSAQDAFRTFWIATGANVLFVGLISGLLIQAARQNRQLERTVRDLKRAEDLRDSLSQMLVHDLRTPLTTLLGPLQMLEAETIGPLDENQKELVTMSTQSGSRLLKMVNGLLDISKLEAGELKLSRTTFPVLTVLQSASRQAKRDGDVSTAPVVVEADPELKLHADHDLIERVIINLLGNALKFTAPDGQIVVRAVQIPQNLRVEVQDSGEGIPAEDLELIFDKFGQVETRERGLKASTGLGLTFCKLAVEAHGGRIGVHSELGRGSTFWFEIPSIG